MYEKVYLHNTHKNPSMIFRTITDDITGANKSIGLFGKSLNDFKGIINSFKHNGVVSTLLNTPLINIDTKAIDNYNNAIRSSIPFEKALDIARRTTNAETVALIESSNGLEVQTERVTAAQKASTIAAKAHSAALKAASIAGNMIAFAVITKGIELVVKGFDNWIHRVEKANEAMKNAVGEYESAKSSLENVNSELKEQNKQLDELLAKDKLTYAEQGQLEELQAITRELLLQQDIEERRADKASKEAADKAVDAYKKQYGRYDKTEDELKEKLSYEFPFLPKGADDVLGIIAAYTRAKELLEKSQKEFDDAVKNGEDTTWLADDVQLYIDTVDDCKQALDDSISDLQDKRVALENEYNKAIEKRESGVEPLTSSEKEIIETYESIYDVMKMVYEYTDPNAWKSMQIESVFDTEGIEKTKEELVEMVKAGTFDESTLQSYPKLSEALEQNKVSASELRNELEALAKAESNVKGDTFNDKYPISFSDVFSLKDAENNLNTLGELNEQLDEIQSAYSNLKDAMDTYSSTGYITIDQFQSIVEQGAKFLDYLTLEDGQLGMNEQAMYDLAEARIIEMKAQMVQGVIDNVSKIQSEADADLYLASTNYELADSYHALAESQLTAWSSSALANGLSQGYVDKVTGKAKADIDKINALVTKINLGSIGNKSTSSATKKAETDWKTFLDKELALADAAFEAGLTDYRTYINKRKAILDQYYREQKISGQEYYDGLKATYEKQLSVYDKALSSVSRRYDREIDHINTLIDNIKSQNDLLEKQKDDYDSVLSVVDRVYQNEIDRINKQKDAIQDKIDALNDEADAYDLIKRKEEALYELQRSRQQRTNKLYTGSDRGYIYDTDRDSIREAQETLKDLEKEELISQLEKEQDALETSITLLGEYRDKWAEIPDEHERILNEQLAAQIFGADYEQMILNNRICDIEGFKDNYLAIQTQIDDNTSLITSYEEKISYYEQLKEQWAQISAAYEESVEDQYASMLLGQNWEADILDGRLETLNGFKDEYARIQQAIVDLAWASSNEQVKAAQEAQKGADGNMGSAGNVDIPVNDSADKPTSNTIPTAVTAGIVTGTNNTSERNNMLKRIAELETKLSEAKTARSKAPNNTTRQKIQDEISHYEYLIRNLEVSLPKYHSGLEKGVVGKPATNKSLEILQRAGLNIDEILAILKEGELVLTPFQTENIADRLKLLEAVDLTPNITLPDYSRLGKMTVRNNVQQPSINIGEIHLHEVQNVDGLTDAIIREFPNKILQAAARRW